MESHKPRCTSNRFRLRPLETNCCTHRPQWSCTTYYVHFLEFLYQVGASSANSNPGDDEHKCHFLEINTRKTGRHNTLRPPGVISIFGRQICRCQCSWLPARWNYVIPVFMMFASTFKVLTGLSLAIVLARFLAWRGALRRQPRNLRNGDSSLAKIGVNLVSCSRGEWSPIDTDVSQPASAIIH